MITVRIAGFYGLGYRALDLDFRVLHLVSRVHGFGVWFADW